ncbi:MAG: YraN family protein [Candidatus Omnitrophica bacterium]|nr:YraN family protein [Candidatus Omnitrophota bacterium]
MDNKTKKELGILGENIAAEYLKKHGYKIIKRNYRNRLGEIDIIAYEGAVLCFIEVKTRADEQRGRPEEAVGKAKQRKISQVVLSYLKMQGIYEGNFRFDVAAVMFNEITNVKKINLIKNAFELDDQYSF